MEPEQIVALSASFFPNEVLIEIFYLMKYEEVVHLGGVSKRFLALSECNTVWLRLIKSTFEKQLWSTWFEGTKYEGDPGDIDVPVPSGLMHRPNPSGIEKAIGSERMCIDSPGVLKAIFRRILSGSSCDYLFKFFVYGLKPVEVIDFLSGNTKEEPRYEGSIYNSCILFVQNNVVKIRLVNGESNSALKDVNYLKLTMASVDGLIYFQDGAISNGKVKSAFEFISPHCVKLGVYYSQDLKCDSLEPATDSRFAIYPGKQFDFLARIKSLEELQPHFIQLVDTLFTKIGTASFLVEPTIKQGRRGQKQLVSGTMSGQAIITLST